MKVAKTVYYGGVEQDNKSIKIFFSGNKRKLLQDINNWLFDYLFYSGREVKQLPPMDDWDHNGETPNYWSINYPVEGWKIWISSDYIDFE